MEWILKKSKFFAIMALTGLVGISSQALPISPQVPKLNALVDRSFTNNEVKLPDDCSGRTDYPHK
jgi:hypothetical protein